MPKQARAAEEPGGTALGNDEFLKDLPRSKGAPRVGPVRLEGRISKGGMGVVYRGHHLKLDIDVAVKFLLPHLAAQNPEYVLRFEREARIAAHLNNENLVRVFDVDSDANYHYVVMELVCGETAKDRVARKGRLSEGEAMEIILGATRGLEAAHRKGIVHRDIKPENIMIDAAGLVKLADLGIAKMVAEREHGEANLTQPGFVMGTPSYMPPEQFTDPGAVSFPGDVYSMGATLYYLLTARPPYSGNVYEIFQAMSQGGFPDIRATRPEVSEAVASILRTATHRLPGARHADATALLRALESSGTGRLNLEDAGTGTVTAVAKVSTPPARRVGELRIELPPAPAADGMGANGDGGRAPGRPARRGGLVVGAIALLGVLFAGGLYVGVEALRNRPSAARPEGSVAAGPATASPAPAPTPAPAPVTPPAAKSERVPPRPGGESGSEIPGSRLETAAAPLRESTPPAAAPAVAAGVEAGKGQGADPPSEESLRRRLERAQQLIRLGDTSSAASMLDSVRDWRGLEARAAELRTTLYLSMDPPQEEVAFKLVASRCAEPGAGVAGSACDLAYRVALARATTPREGASPGAFLLKLDFLGRLGPPPAGLKELSAAHESARRACRGGYLKAQIAAAAAAAKEYDLAGAKAAVGSARQFAEREGIAAVFADEMSRLREVEGSLDLVAREVGAWNELRPLIPISTADLARLSVAELRSRAERFGAFAAAYPQNPNRRAAEEYRRRYEREVEERKPGK